ncbi:hypothetical protein [Novosphingobium sp. ZW T3_23]|uniref:hypothetical protein n=1 Tax=Novosphingobium sp. ZW T3_23 TaxID=3378084 RepID=UPI003854DD1A
MTTATHIEVEARVRYWEDASVNGTPEDNDAPTIPLRNGDNWCPRIRLSDGLVEGWPAGVTADVHFKVCDEGLYWLTGASGERLMKWSGYYVPNDFLCPADEGFGDYIIMQIGEGGKIADWSVPEIDADEWESIA